MVDAIESVLDEVLVFLLGFLPKNLRNPVVGFIM